MNINCGNGSTHRTEERAKGSGSKINLRRESVIKVEERARERMNHDFLVLKVGGWKPVTAL